MRHIRTGRKRAKFNLVFATSNAQAAMMTLRPGGKSEETPDNEHSRSEQWLFVLEGAGEARIGKKRGSLRRVGIEKNSLLVIEKGELHQIVNTGQKSLVTLNIYVPPAYHPSGQPLGWVSQLLPKS